MIIAGQLAQKARTFLAVTFCSRRKDHATDCIVTCGAAGGVAGDGRLGVGVWPPEVLPRVVLVAPPVVVAVPPCAATSCCQPACEPRALRGALQFVWLRLVRPAPGPAGAADDGPRRRPSRCLPPSRAAERSATERPVGATVQLPPQRRFLGKRQWGRHSCLPCFQRQT